MITATTAAAWFTFVAREFPCDRLSLRENRACIAEVDRLWNAHVIQFGTPFYVRPIEHDGLLSGGDTNVF